MTAAVHVRKFKARYRLPGSQADERRRLDRVLSDVVSDSFDHALALAGVDAREEICIREVYVPLRLKRLPGDPDLAAAWSAALAEALARAARGVRSPYLVRYRYRAEALLDMAECAIAGDDARVWAWKRMGLWSGPDRPGRREAVAGWVRAMAGEPASIAPVLRVLAERAVSGRAQVVRLFAELAGPDWQLLAREALLAAGGDPGWLDGTYAPGTHEPSSRALRLVSNSPLGAALAAARPGMAVEAGVRRAQAALLLLERDPGAVRAPRLARVLVDSIADLLIATPATDDIAKPAGSGRSRPVPAQRDAARPAAPAACNRGEEAGGEISGADRDAARTRYGGLLYLVNLVRDLQLPDELANADWTDKPFRWVIHALGMLLSGAEAGDPAALAFCGLPPDAQPPSADEAPPAAAELAALEALRARVVDALAERLAGEELTPAAVLPWLCLRDAEIAADPGWIDVRLSLRDVSTSIRAAALDLDPGYVDWLGVVMRFVYA